MQTKTTTHYHTANAFETLGFTTTASRAIYYPTENHEPAAGMVGPVPSAVLLARLLDDVAAEGWVPVRSGSRTPLTREEAIVLCQTDTATLFFQRSVVGGSAAPSPDEIRAGRQRGQEAALALPEWPRSAVLGRSRGMWS